MNKNLMNFAMTLVLSFSGVVAHANQGEKIRKEVAALQLAIAGKLAHARAAGLVCDAEAYVVDVMEYLYKGTSYHGTEALRAHVKKNPIFMKVLGDNFAFRALLLDPFGLTNPNHKLLEKILVGSVIYRPASGAYGNTRTVEFLANGELKVKDLDIDTLKWIETRGSYKLLPAWGDHGQIEMEIGGDRRVYKLDAKFPYFEFNFNPVKDGAVKYDSSPSECEA